MSQQSTPKEDFSLSAGVRAILAAQPLNNLTRVDEYSSFVDNEPEFQPAPQPGTPGCARDQHAST